MKKLLIHFARFGPYHLARLQSAQTILEPMGWQVSGLQVCSSDATYQWDPLTSTENSESAGRLPIQTVFPEEHYESIPTTRLRAGILESLDQASPDAIAVAGWGTPDARACLKWCGNHAAFSILMSETRYADGKRVWWKERLKSRLVRQFDAAIVGAQSHADYLVGMGQPASAIARGYNVIDNRYFVDATDQILARQPQRPFPYFLASNRFVERKNLVAAIEAYARYLADEPETKWNLCLLGDGPTLPAVATHAGAHGIRVIESAPWDDPSATDDTSTNAGQPPTVYLPGFRQVDQLPRFYAHAGAFVHPAISEPWGLVINEAMASGLPILAAENGGAAEELVVTGENGERFDPQSTSQMAAAMLRISGRSAAELQQAGQASRRLVEKRAATLAFGRGLASLLEPVTTSS